MFSVYDSKAKAYIPPFFFPKVAMAIRVFTDSVNDPHHQFNKHPEDYTLFEIGIFDDETGQTKSCNPESHGVGIQYIAETSPATQLDLGDEIGRLMKEAKSNED